MLWLAERPLDYAIAWDNATSSHEKCKIGQTSGTLHAELRLSGVGAVGGKGYEHVQAGCWARFRKGMGKSIDVLACRC